jgi:hypothetical protein
MTKFRSCAMWWMVVGVILAACTTTSPSSPAHTPSVQGAGRAPTPIAAEPKTFESPLTVESPLPTPPISLVVETPKPGRSSVSGVIWSMGGNGPIPGTSLYLTPVQSVDPESQPLILGPQNDRGDVRGVSDAEGRFVFANIPSGRYFLYVWAPLNWIAATQNPNTEDLFQIVLAPDAVVDLGRVDVPWP